MIQNHFFPPYHMRLLMRDPTLLFQQIDKIPKRQCVKWVDSERWSKVWGSSVERNQWTRFVQDWWFTKSPKYQLDFYIYYAVVNHRYIVMCYYFYSIRKKECVWICTSGCAGGWIQQVTHSVSINVCLSLLTHCMKMFYKETKRFSVLTSKKVTIVWPLASGHPKVQILENWQYNQQ